VKPVIISRPSQLDVKRLIAFISAKNIVTALKVSAILTEAVTGLKQFPYRGRPSHFPELRELIAVPCVILYRMTETNIEIVHIYHSAENWKNK
jgi:plasmid stabilization system protein ParE